MLFSTEESLNNICDAIRGGSFYLNEDLRSDNASGINSVQPTDKRIIVKQQP